MATCFDDDSPFITVAIAQVQMSLIWALSRSSLRWSDCRTKCRWHGKYHGKRLRLQETPAPHLLRRTRTAYDLRFPSCQLWRGRIVRLECSPGAGQVFYPMLCESDHGETKSRDGQRTLLRTDFHAGDRLCITGSSVGGSFRMWCNQECHSGGTCEAWYSCCVKK